MTLLKDESKTSRKTTTRNFQFLPSFLRHRPSCQFWIYQRSVFQSPNLPKRHHQRQMIATSSSRHKPKKTGRRLLQRRRKRQWHKLKKVDFSVSLVEMVVFHLLLLRPRRLRPRQREMPARQRLKQQKRDERGMRDLQRSVDVKWKPSNKK